MTPNEVLAVCLLLIATSAFCVRLSLEWVRKDFEKRIKNLERGWSDNDGEEEGEESA